MQSPKNAPAGFGTRLIAYIIDTLLVDLAIVFCMFPVIIEKLVEADSIWNQEVLFDHSVYAIVVYVIRAIYFVIMTYTMGATLGKKLLRIQVETADGGKLTFVNVLFRETVGRFLSGILYVGYLIALGGREHLALHDMLCDTRVCYRDLAEAVRPQVRETPNPYQPDFSQTNEYTMPQQPKQERQEPTPIYRDPANSQEEQRETQPTPQQNTQPQGKYGDYVLPQMAKQTPEETADDAKADKPAAKETEGGLDDDMRAAIAAAYGKTDTVQRETKAENDDAAGTASEKEIDETGGDGHESNGF